MKKLMKEKSWLKCLTMLKEVQLEKCKFRMRKRSLVKKRKKKKELKSNKFSEVVKTSKMKNRMKNMKWARKKMVNKT